MDAYLAVKVLDEDLELSTAYDRLHPELRQDMSASATRERRIIWVRRLQVTRKMWQGSPDVLDDVDLRVDLDGLNVRFGLQLSLQDAHESHACHDPAELSAQSNAMSDKSAVKDWECSAAAHVLTLE